MRSAYIYRNKELAGILSKEDDRTYTFRYDDMYYQNPSKRAVSLTLPKSQQEYKSKFLFPFFFSLLSEGKNKALQCRHLQIDEKDYFSLLLAIAQHDTIGAVTVKPVKE